MCNSKKLEYLITNLLVGRSYAIVKIAESAMVQRSAVKYSYQKRPLRLRGPTRLLMLQYPTATSVSEISVVYLDVG
jgi:hypothetical protein